MGKYHTLKQGEVPELNAALLQDQRGNLTEIRKPSKKQLKSLKSKHQGRVILPYETGVYISNAEN